MTYTFVGNKDFIKKETEKISEKFNAENITYYNLTEESVDKVIIACPFQLLPPPV